MEAIKDTDTSAANSLDSNIVILDAVAPSAFLMPISFVLCCALNATRPNRPRTVITIVRTEKAVNRRPWSDLIFCTRLYVSFGAC